MSDNEFDNPFCICKTFTKCFIFVTTNAVHINVALFFVGYYMYIETSSPRVQGDNAKLNSPLLNFNGNMCVEFFYHMYGKTTGSLKVIINNTKAVFSATEYNVNGWRRSRTTVTLLGLYTVREIFIGESLLASLLTYKST